MPKGRTANNTVDVNEIKQVESCTIPPVPKFIKGEAKAEWDRVTKLMLELGTLQERDMATIAAYCQTWGQYVKLQSDMDAMGAVVEGSRGQLRGNPLIEQNLKVAASLRQYAGELKLTPASRGVKVNQETGRNAALKPFIDGLDAKDDEDFDPAEFERDRPTHAVEKPISKE